MAMKVLFKNAIFANGYVRIIFNGKIYTL